MKTTLADRFRIILNELDISQKEFAHSLGVSRQLVNAIKNGKKNSISKTLAKHLQDIYEYDYSWVLGDETARKKIAENSVYWEEVDEIVNSLILPGVDLTMNYIDAMVSGL
jgi:transcriptional regulator with XRE-family HTH domain